MTAAEVAPIIRASVYQVTQLCKTRKLRATRPAGKWLIEPAAIREFLEAGIPSDQDQAAS